MNDFDIEVIEAVEDVSPLIAIPAEDIERLTPRKQRFLISYIQSGSLTKARKAEGVSLKRWKLWLDDPDFQRVFNIVKSPVLFTHALVQSIIMTAAQEHLKLLRHSRVQVRQWGIDRAYELARALDTVRKQERGEDIRSLSQGDVRALAESVAAKLEDAERKKIDKSPFQIVEGEVVGSFAGSSATGLSASEE